MQKKDDFTLEIVQMISLDHKNRYNKDKFSSSQLTMGNDSINQIIPKQQNHQYSYVLSSSIIQINNSKKKILPMTCYYTSTEFVLLKILFSKYLKFSINYQKEYVIDLYVDDFQNIKLEFYLLKADLGRIIKLRERIHGKEGQNVHVNKTVKEILEEYKGIIDEMYFLMKLLKQKSMNKKDKVIVKYYLQKIKEIKIIPNFQIKKVKQNKNLLTYVTSTKSSQQILIIDKFSSTKTFQLLIDQEYPLKYIEQIKSQTLRLIYLMDEQIKKLTQSKQTIQNIFNNKFKENYMIKLLKQCEIIRMFLDGKIKVEIQINYQNQGILKNFLNFDIIGNQNGKKQYLYKKQFKDLNWIFRSAYQKNFLNEKGLKMLAKHIDNKICKKQQNIQIELQQIYSQISKYHNKFVFYVEMYVHCVKYLQVKQKGNIKMTLNYTCKRLIRILFTQSQTIHIMKFKHSNTTNRHIHIYSRQNESDS